MKTIKVLFLMFLTFSLAACSNEQGKKKRGADYSLIQKDLNLEAEKNQAFQAITEKYDAERKSFRETLGEHPDRVTLFSKYEELQTKQDAEVEAILTPEQFTQYREFVKKNTRKRPRYNQALLDSIQTNAGLDENQMQVVRAANDAFEKSYHDAHDIYHGNAELAKKYWKQYDDQRKQAIESVLTPEQYTAFLEAVKNEGPVREK